MPTACWVSLVNFLNMTQVEAGKLQMMPKITKPIELIEYAIKANQVQADKFGIQIRSKVSGGKNAETVCG